MDRVGRHPGGRATALTDADEESIGWAEVARGLSAAQELARIGSFVWEPGNDTVQVSPELMRLLGLSPESTPHTGAGWETRLHPGDRPRVKQAVASTLSSGAAQRVEFRLQASARSFCWVEGRLIAERERGRPLRIRGTLQDIDERKLGQSDREDRISEQIQVGRLRDAIATERLALAGQEIVDLADGSTVMHELLVRYIDDRGQVVPAGEFLCLAETHRMIEEIDAWVLKRAVEVAATGRAVAVNVSAQTMSDPAYAEEVLRLIVAREVDPNLITFEITETALVENLNQAQAFAARLELLGCTLALDDFGTGYGALTYLKQFPAHHLKIDREFVTDVLSNQRSRAVITGIVSLARSFGQRTIAEGVESPAVLESLRELGVDLAQGYLIGRPHLLGADLTLPGRIPQARGMRGSR